MKVKTSMEVNKIQYEFWAPLVTFIQSKKVVMSHKFPINGDNFRPQYLCRSNYGQLTSNLSFA